MYDLVIFNGKIVSASDVTGTDVFIGIKNGIIETISSSKLEGLEEIDAQGAFITPGGVDAHVHIDQRTVPDGDNFESGTRSAIAGGTTTVISFAEQYRGEKDLVQIARAYHELAAGKTYCDYGFHMIMTDPQEEVLENLKTLVESEGITSVKIYTTYTKFKVNDGELLKILLAARSLNITTMIHAENSDLIDFITEKLEQKALMEPYYHAPSRPVIAEDEASYRVISLSKFIDVPILIVHMSSKAALDHVRKAQTKLIPVYAETCPQYLFLTSDYLKHDHFPAHQPKEIGPHDHFRGAKYVCSPPLRDSQQELDEVWAAISNGTVTIFSSDHAPSKYDSIKGKKRGLINGIPNYREIPNGLAGLETRLPLLFCNGVETGRISPQKFVELSSTNPAKLYGLSEKKGTIAVGMDADITIWYPKGGLTPFKLSNDMLHHDIDYTAYEGMTFTNWPRYAILRGKVMYEHTKGLIGKSGDGKYLRRGGSALAGPTSELNPLFR